MCSARRSESMSGFSRSRSVGCRSNSRAAWLYAGRLDREKQVDLLLAVLPRLLERADVSVTVAGNGAFRSEFERLRHPRFPYAGYVRDPDELARSLCRAVMTSIQSHPARTKRLVWRRSKQQPLGSSSSDRIRAESARCFAKWGRRSHSGPVIRRASLQPSWRLSRLTGRVHRSRVKRSPPDTERGRMPSLVCVGTYERLIDLGRS